MRTGTKLHFINPENPQDKIEEYFIGGALPYAQYTGSSGEIKYSVTYTKYTDLGVPKTYYLCDEDFNLFIDKTNIQINNTTYRKILPVYDIYSLKQNLESRCSIVKGELPYNTQHGIPLNAQLQDTQLSIVNIINNTPGVAKCEVISSKLIDNKFKLQVKIASTYGTFMAYVG